MLGERPRDAADPPVRLARQELLFRFAPLPEPRDGEGQERQRTAPALDGADHLVHERVVLEPVAAPRGRLDERPPQPVARHRAERRQRVEDGREGLERVAAHQEVVAQRQEDVDVGLAREPPEESGESRLRLRRVEREELLELVDDEKGVLVGPPPAREELEGRFAVLERPRACGAPRGRSRAAAPSAARGRAGAHSPASPRSPAQPSGRAGITPALTNDVLPAPEGPITARSFRSCSFLQRAADLLLAAEEAPRILLGEGREARIRALLLDVAQRRRRAAAFENGLERAASSCAD